MKSFQLFIFGLAIIATFAVPTVAQKEKTPVVLTNKIAVFNPTAFEDKQSGIKELVVVYDRLDAELKPKYDELNTSPIKVKLEEIYKELLLKKEILERHTVGCLEPKFLQRIEARLGEYNKLHSEYESEAKKYKSLYEKRKSEIVAPVNNKIGDALKQFAKQNGHMMVLDSSQKNIFSPNIEVEIIDITKEFIQFYNDYSEKGNAQ